MRNTNTIFQFKDLDFALGNAIQSSFTGTKLGQSNPHFWASTVLKDHVEKAMQGWLLRSKALNATTGQTGPGDPPTRNGFKINLGLQIQLSYKVRFKTNLDFGYGFRKGNLAGTASIHLSSYNNGLGVSVGKNDLVFDVTAAVNMTVGAGNGIPLKSYSLNYNSPIPIPNDFNTSFSYGQLLTWNSALHQQTFSLEKLQREGLIGFRVFNVNVSSNNDTKRFYFGGGTDMGWTGGISISTPFIELGFQDFSGNLLTTNIYQSREDILSNIKSLNADSLLSNDEKRDQKVILYRRLDNILLEHPYHYQSPYQKKLNKASTYIRFNNQGYNATMDIIGEAWLQNLIHKKIKDFKFEYEYKKIETWVGKSW